MSDPTMQDLEDALNQQAESSQALADTIGESAENDEQT